MIHREELFHIQGNWGRVAENGMHFRISVLPSCVIFGKSSVEVGIFVNFGQRRSSFRNSCIETQNLDDFGLVKAKIWHFSLGYTNSWHFDIELVQSRLSPPQELV